MKKSKDKKRAIVSIILDESGSMGSVVDDTIGGFNQYVNTLKNDKGTKYEVSLTLFNSSSRVIYSKKPISEVPLLDHENYQPREYTALLDAVGKTLNALADVEDKTKSIVVIITDGHENASREFKATQIRDMIHRRDAKDNWTFVYLGAVADAWDQGAALGINLRNVANYSGEATMDAFVGTGDATLCAANTVGKVRSFYGEGKVFKK